MSFFWILVILLSIVILGGLAFTIGQFFSKERKLLNEAEQKIERGQEEQAVSLLSRVTELNPANFQARWRLAKLLQMMGQYGAAAFHYEYCLQNQYLPGHVRDRDALNRLADVYEQQNQFEQAADTWSRYLQQVPDSMEGYFRRGKNFFELGKYDRALSDFKKIRSEFPEEEPRQNALFIGRSYVGKEEHERGLNYLEEYLDERPDDLEAGIEAARAAKTSEQFQEAKNWFEHVRDRAGTSLYVEATIRLIRLSLEQGDNTQAMKYLEELEEIKEENELRDQHLLHIQYLRARVLENQGKREEAVDLYWDIYEERPEFLDVPEIIEGEIGRMDPDELLDEFTNMDKQRFSELCGEIVELMGYELIKVEPYGLYEVNATAREGGQGLKSDRILITFKRWESQVGEWPIREFELSLLEDRYDRGIFVAPHGFQPNARSFAEDSSIRLIGPDTLIQYLREAHKKTP